MALLEAMAYGMPIACSNYGPMPEILGEAGAFFAPLNPDSIADALVNLLLDLDLRNKISAAARERSRIYSWQASARDTFGLLGDVWKRG
jgi:glycosyltransferase involved in cell wall biosynthesis